MRHSERSDAFVRRYRILSLVVAAAFIPLIVDNLFHLLAAPPGAVSHGGWLGYAAALSPLVLGITTIVVAFRSVRTSKIPHIGVICLLMGLMIAMIVMRRLAAV